MKKIYLVMSGDYEPTVRAAFDDRTLAEGWMKLHSHYDYMQIDEWALNPCEDIIRKGLNIYRFEMKEDGSYERHDYPYDAKNEVMYDFRTVKTAHVSNQLTYAVGDVVMDFQVCAKSDLTALKMTNKLRLKLIKEGKWGVNPK